MLLGLEGYYQAFLELHTCRAVGFGVGAIPWTAIDAYARRHGLEGEEYEDFEDTVRALDNAYLAHQQEKARSDNP